MRPTRFEDLPDALRSRVASSVFEFDSQRDAIDRETEVRGELAEHEHLIYFLLQSNSFTSRPSIDPITSAQQTVAQDFRPTPFVRARMRDFLTALEQPSADARMAYWQTHLAKEQRTQGALEINYREAMQFLTGDPASSLRRRGHGTDAGIGVNFTVWSAIGTLPKFIGDGQFENVLIVGPGQDFAPVSGFRDDSLPQSYEPYLTADALLDWKLADERFLRVHCVDINARVLDILKEFQRSSAPRLVLPYEEGRPDFAAWFRKTGQNIGSVSQDQQKRTVTIRPSLVKNVTGSALNIVTQRLVPNPEFDLAVITNVLTYYGEREVLLALINLHAMLKPGAIVIHNDRRPETGRMALDAGFDELYSQAVGKDGFTLLRRQIDQ